MSTKDKFLKDVKEVMNKYQLQFRIVPEIGVPDYTTNNRPNYAIKAIELAIPGEDVKVIISGKEFVDYVTKN